MNIGKVALVCLIVTVVSAAFAEESAPDNLLSAQVGFATLNGVNQNAVILTLHSGDIYYFAIGPRWVDYVMAQFCNNPRSSGNVQILYSLTVPEQKRLAYGIMVNVGSYVPLLPSSGSWGNASVGSWSVKNALGDDNSEFSFSVWNFGSDYYYFRIPFSESEVDLLKNYWIANILRHLKMSVQYDAVNEVITNISFTPNLQ